MNKLLSTILVTIFVSVGILIANDASALNCGTYVTQLTRTGTSDVGQCLAVLANGCKSDGGTVVGKGSGYVKGGNTYCSLSCQECAVQTKPTKRPISAF